MEIAITKMSPNGQVVIPAEVRRKANIRPAEKFLVFEKDGNIMLKKMGPAQLREYSDFAESIARAEEQVRKGHVLRLDGTQSPEEMARRIDAHARRVHGRVHKDVRKDT